MKCLLSMSSVFLLCQSLRSSQHQFFENGAEVLFIVSSSIDMGENLLLSRVTVIVSVVYRCRRVSHSILPAAQLLQQKRSKSDRVVARLVTGAV
jgi:hypothetical protein